MAEQNVLNYLDGYCERAGEPGLWSEPLNAVTNLFFILAAVLAARALWRRTGQGNRTDLWLLAVLLFAIGVGSGLWHLFASQHTMLMDVIPIGLFIYVYLASALGRLFGLRTRWVALWWLVYFGISLLAQKYLPPDLFNGTVMYLPTYGLMAVMAAALWGKNRASAVVFLQVLMVWTLSLAARTFDMALCPHWPLGTHFLWHMLNAWVLWRLLMLLIAPDKQK